MSKTVKKIRTDGVPPSRSARKNQQPPLLPDRDANVTKIAYAKAKSRNFLPGYGLDDWLAAEKEFSF